MSDRFGDTFGNIHAKWMPTSGGAYETRDEAVQKAIDDCEPGGQVVVHEDHCAESMDAPCDCAPQIIHVGNKVTM